MTNPIGGSKGARRFWQAIGAAPNAMMMHDRAGKIVMVNTQAERAFGCSRAELIGQPVEILLPERFRGRHPELRETFFADPQPRPMGVGRDLYGLKKDGGEFPVEIGLNPIETDQGTMVLTVIVDITARKAAEQALRESERRYSILVEGVTDYAIIMLDPNGIVTNWNRGAQRIKGYGAEEIVGQHFSRFYTDEDRAANEPQHGLEIAAQNGRYEAEALRVRKDGSRFWANVVIDAVKDDNDQLIGFTKITRDITERVQAAQKLEEARMAELAHLARVASLGELTASIAHEVIQPIAAARINAASGLRFLSMNPPDLKEVRQSLEGVVRDADRAGEVVSRIRALIRKAPFQKDRVAIDDAILEVVALTRGEAVKNRVSVRTQLAEGLPPVEGERVQLQQVILNLIMNAIEAMSGQNEAPRELLLSTETAEPDEVLVVVGDSGPGLPPAALERLFDAFYTTKPNGMGMGLSICRSIIKAHGGRLWATANSPRGAVFQFTLPISPTNS